jgi:zinc transport system substrate-binding protein
MKNRNAIVIFTFSILLACSFLGCLSHPDDDDGMVLIVTIPPQEEFVKAIGGDLVDVTVMVPPGESPHTYAPVPSQMKKVARAEAYFKVGSGVEFEMNHMDELKAQNGDMSIFDCSAGIELLEMGGDDHDHDHGDDPHIWLSPVNARTMVENIYQGLIKLDEDNKDTYEKNRDEYLSKLDTLHGDLVDGFQDHAQELFLVYHPSFGYLAHEYDLEQIAIEEDGKEPGPAGIASMVEQAKGLNITVIYVDPSFDQTRAETIAKELGGKVLTLDPLASDYIDNLRRVADRLEQGLSKG